MKIHGRRILLKSFKLQNWILGVSTVALATIVYIKINAVSKQLDPASVVIHDPVTSLRVIFDALDDRKFAVWESGVIVYIGFTLLFASILFSIRSILYPLIFPKLKRLLQICSSQSIVYADLSVMIVNNAMERLSVKLTSLPKAGYSVDYDEIKQFRKDIGDVCRAKQFCQTTFVDLSEFVSDSDHAAYLAGERHHLNMVVSNGQQFTRIIENEDFRIFFDPATLNAKSETVRKGLIEFVKMHDKKGVHLYSVTKSLIFTFAHGLNKERLDFLTHDNTLILALQTKDLKVVCETKENGDKFYRLYIIDDAEEISNYHSLLENVRKNCVDHTNEQMTGDVIETIRKNQDWRKFYGLDEVSPNLHDQPNRLSEVLHLKRYSQYFRQTSTRAAILDPPTEKTADNEVQPDNKDYN